MRTLKNLGNIVLKKVAQILLYSKHSTFVLVAMFFIGVYNGSLPITTGDGILYKNNNENLCLHNVQVEDSMSILTISHVQCLKYSWLYAYSML